MAIELRVARLGLAVVALIAGLFARSLPARAQQLSPGPLSRAHASIDSVNACTRCHERGDRIEAARCLQCHDALGDRMRANVGYHSHVTGQPCERCHAEHLGVSASIIRWPEGAEARFDHARWTGYRLEDGHARLRCRQCHTTRYQTVPAVRRMGAGERARTWLGLSTACASCHEDRHRPSLGARCEQCHDAREWRRVSSGFDHSRTRFPLRGGHARVACDRCHTRANASDPMTFRGVAFERCVDCHRDPHGGRMTGRLTCEGCHTESAWNTLTFDRATHGDGRFELSGGHADPPCTRCHGEHLDREVERACASCHDDPHRPSLGERCEQCHSTSTWLRSRGRARDPSRDFHDRTAYPLRGEHVTVACDRCHSPRLPASRRFRPIAHDTCATCHRDPHQGELSARADHGACESCHAVEGWRPVRYEREDHARTRFPLEGAHEAVACQSCHPASPRAPGFRRESIACVGCHADVHAGQFFSAGRNPTGCVACHSLGGWIPSTFDAARHAAAGFELSGAHNVRCGRCHASPGANQPARYVGTPSDCGACHHDAHEAQFAGRACVTCHRGDRFAPAPNFDHARTTFALTGAHVFAGCNGCHLRAQRPEARNAVVYRLPSNACASCHEGPHGRTGDRASAREVALFNETRDCARCHDASRWSSLTATPAFDHANARVPLVGGHSAVPCARCHTGARAMPEMAQCNLCHEDRHRGQLGSSCERCHTPRTWTPDGALLDHERTRMPLVGVHAALGCVQCHTRAANGDYRDATPECASCHTHTVDERRPHPPHTTPAMRASCDRCHAPTGWTPASFDHAAFWPLVGRHATTECARCHTSGRYAGTPSTCVSCHDGAQRRSRYDHATFPDPTRCESCHDATAWTPARFPHDRYFPLSGPHSLTCAQCHTDPSSLMSFACTECHAHSQSRMGSEHGGVSGYTWESRACYRCHPTGGS